MFVDLSARDDFEVEQVFARCVTVLEQKIGLEYHRDEHVDDLEQEQLDGQVNVVEVVLAQQVLDEVKYFE